MLLALVALLVAAPAQREYTPPSGQGRAVIMLSGHTGPPLYVSYAEHLAAAGYYVVLLDGKDILNRDRQGDARLDLAALGAAASLVIESPCTNLKHHKVRVRAIYSFTIRS